MQVSIFASTVIGWSLPGYLTACLACDLLCTVLRLSLPAHLVLHHTDQLLLPIHQCRRISPWLSSTFSLTSRTWYPSSILPPPHWPGHSHSELSPLVILSPQLTTSSTNSSLRYLCLLLMYWGCLDYQYSVLILNTSELHSTLHQIKKKKNQNHQSTSQEDHYYCNNPLDFTGYWRQTKGLRKCKSFFNTHQSRVVRLYQANDCCTNHANRWFHLNGRYSYMTVMMYHVASGNLLQVSIKFRVSYITCISIPAG